MKSCFATLLAFALVLAGCALEPASLARPVLARAESAQGSPSARSLPQCGTSLPAVHGMLMVGRRTIYLSHLPMFHAPHDYQAILQVELAAAASDPTALYNQDRERTGTPLYTLVPEPFVLADVVNHRRSFHATIFRGHFERGGVAIASHVGVSIKRVVLFRQFDPTATRPAQAHYWLFGHGSETFLAHAIAVAPDFDQVVAVSPAHPLPDAVQEAGLGVTLGDRPDTLPLTPGATLATASDRGPQALTVGEEFYRETGDLAR